MNRPIFFLLATIVLAVGLVIGTRLLLSPPPPIIERSVTTEMVEANETVTFMTISGNYDRETKVVAASLQDVLNTPSWVDFPNNPPLTLSQAVDIARRWQEQQGLYAPLINSVNLQEKPRGSKKWSYTIYFDPNTDQKMTKGKRKPYVVVLFDGSVAGTANLKPKK